MQRQLDEQLEERRRDRLNRYVCRTLWLAYRHRGEYPAGPILCSEQLSIHMDIMDITEVEVAADMCGEDAVETWPKDEPQTIRSTEPCPRCLALAAAADSPPMDPHHWCMHCTSRDMCHVYFAHGKVIIPFMQHERWTFNTL